MKINSTEYKKGFTLAEVLVTLAVMGIVLALVVTFTVATSDATQQRTALSETLEEIEDLNDIVTDWFYSFDNSEFAVTDKTPEDAQPEHIYNFLEDTVVSITTNYITIQNKDFNKMMDGGIVPTNYQLVYSVDRTTYKKAITAIYSSDSSKNVSLTLNRVTDIKFDWDNGLGLFKCTYTYKDVENGNVNNTYTLVLQRHTKG